MRRVGWRRLVFVLCGLSLGASEGLAARPAPPAWASEPGATAAQVDSLRAAIADLGRTFPGRYPSQVLRDRLDRLIAARGSTPPAQFSDQWRALRREALLGNPLVSGQPILFVARPQYKPDHHNTETMFQTGEINTAKFEGPAALKTIDFARAGAVRTVLEVPEGIARDPDLGFDGRTVLFAMRRNRADDYHLYTIGVDGSGLKQLTFGSGTSDLDPIWLPNGRILFTSTREPKYCMCNRHIMGNLFAAEADGSNVRQIGHSTLHEGHSALLPDGRVLYDRWEYVDRNFGDAQGLWTVHPEGTNHAVYYGNNTNSPGAVLEGRPIPGSERIVCTFSSCHDRPWGAIAILDRRRAIDLEPAVVRIWPAEARALIGKGNYDTFKQVQPKYEDPYPLSDKYFLCSRMTGRGEEMGLYLLDVFGNEILLHREGAGCYDPMPLRPVPQPPVIPPRIDMAREEGCFYVADVYQGFGMERIERGSVKSLRVVESPEKRFFTASAWDGGTGQQAPGMAWNDFNNKRILGTVPVEADGSAYFAVPADRFVYFQLLDERGMMVQSMRSGTIARPGETSGCVGCHENRRTSVPTGPAKLALGRPASRLQPWYGPERTFGYLAEVQPVLDKHCKACHDYGQEAGRKLNLAGDLNLVFNTSYVELRGKGYASAIGAGPYQVQSPKSWGSHASRLVKFLLDGHGRPEIDRKVRLDREAFDRVVTWIDINAPYYPDYATSYPDNPYGRSPLGLAELDRLGKLTGVNFRDRKTIGLVSFNRPEVSACLAGLKPRGSQWAEAVEILRAGQQRLLQTPRTDMPGFRLVSRKEIDQQAKYEALRAAVAPKRGGE